MTPTQPSPWKVGSGDTEKGSFFHICEKYFICLMITPASTG
jgi:hypothetical protein